VKILDFGLARFASEVLPDLLPAEQELDSGTEATAHYRPAPITLTDMVLGTADYIAPEQASAPLSADIRADIYSLGCTLYYLLTGYAPFPEGSLVQKLKAHSEQLPRPIAEIRPDVPVGVARVLDRMMAKDRSLRFQRPREVAEALAPFVVANPLQGEATDLETSKEVNASSVAALAPLAETQANLPRPEPSVETQTTPPRARISGVALVALLLGTMGLFWAKPPRWPVMQIACLLTGYAGFFSLDAARWPVTALFSLLIGTTGFLRLETPSWVWPAHLSLLVCYMRALRMISHRQFSVALLSLLIGCAGLVALGPIWPAGGFQYVLLGSERLTVSLLSAFAGPLVVITFRQLDRLPPVRKKRAWACLAILVAVCAAGIAFACR